MSEPKPLASGIVELVAAALDRELGRARKVGDVDTQDVARRVTIELLDHLEARGALFGRRHGPPGPPPQMASNPAV